MKDSNCPEFDQLSQVLLLREPSCWYDVLKYSNSVFLRCFFAPLNKPCVLILLRVKRLWLRFFIPVIPCFDLEEIFVSLCMCVAFERIPWVARWG